MKCNGDCFNCVYDDCILGLEEENTQGTVKNEERKRYRRLGIGSDRTSEAYKAYHIEYNKRYRVRLNMKRSAKREEGRKRKKAMKNKNKFGAWLRNTRKELGLTQFQMGKKLYLECTSISNYERGKVQPTFATVQRIADELGYEVKIVKKGS